jgi:sugar lactone lactonase YvrE
VRVLVREIDGKPLGLVNDLDLAADGTIYFSESSTETTDTLLDLLEHRANGRLLAYRPGDGEVEVLLDGLYYANGVAVSADGSFVLVVETTTYRVRRFWLSGPRRGEDEIFIGNLPGFPDGISCDDDGVFWIALMNPRNGFIDWALERPWIRKVAARLPLAWFASAAPRYGFVLGLDADGNVLYNLQDPTGRRYAGISCVIRHGDFLFFGSLLENAVGVLSFP